MGIDGPALVVAGAQVSKELVGVGLLRGNAGGPHRDLAMPEDPEMHLAGLTTLSSYTSNKVKCFKIVPHFKIHYLGQPQPLLKCFKGLVHL